MWPYWERPHCITMRDKPAVDSLACARPLAPARASGGEPFKTQCLAEPGL